MRFVSKLRSYANAVTDVQRRLERVQMALGRLESRFAPAAVQRLSDAEYQVFSQWGEDGIIQHLVRAVPVKKRVFVEFGVQDYTESNTRFLLANNNWSGLVIDGNPEHIAFIKRDPIYWRFNLKAECAFIDRDNINTLIAQAGISGEIGLLSIDIDGNDYWVWEALTVVSPGILVLEYNAIFGAQAAVTVPYDPLFARSEAHFSNLYWGASLAALTQLSARKGYVLVGCNSAGNNAFFVRKDLLGQMSEATLPEAYVPAQFRESRSADGQSTYLSVAEARSVIKDALLVDLSTKTTAKFGDLIQS